MIAFGACDGEVRTNSMARMLALLTLAVTLISGCVSRFVGPGSPTTTTPTGGKLYVSTPTSILRFGSALTANGNVAPEVTVSGSGTQLSSPRRLLIDTSTDRLFVANSGGPSILIFSNASTMSSSATPSAVLTSTGNILSPVDVAIDSTNNLLYVADGKNVLVFVNQSAFSGNVSASPARIVNFTFTVGAIFLDAANNVLFVADATDNAVVIVPGANAANGSGGIFGSIAGTGTQLNLPNGVVRDSGGRVIVSNAGSPASVTIYPATTVSNGSGIGVPPAGVITGSSTNLTVPGQMAFNGNTGDLYVADTQAPGVLIFQNISSLNTTTNLAPGRVIIGSGTNLNANSVNGLALDTTR
jgi:hypothetical protein